MNSEIELSGNEWTWAEISIAGKKKNKMKKKRFLHVGQIGEKRAN